MSATVDTPKVGASGCAAHTYAQGRPDVSARELERQVLDQKDGRRRANRPSESGLPVAKHREPLWTGAKRENADDLAASGIDHQAVLDPVFLTAASLCQRSGECGDCFPVMRRGPVRPVSLTAFWQVIEMVPVFWRTPKTADQLDFRRCSGCVNSGQAAHRIINQIRAFPVGSRATEIVRISQCARIERGCKR